MKKLSFVYLAGFLNIEVIWRGKPSVIRMNTSSIAEHTVAEAELVSHSFNERNRLSISGLGF